MTRASRRRGAAASAGSIAIALATALLFMLCLHNTNASPSRQRSQIEHDLHGVQRALMATSLPPSTVTQGSVNVVFPQAAFGIWCDTNAQCSVAGNLSLSLVTYNATSRAALTVSNLPFTRPAEGGFYFRIVSSVVNYQLIGLDRSNRLICNPASPCTSTLTFQVAGADTTAPFYCLRFEPLQGSATATSAAPLNLRHVGGYPDAFNGTTRASILAQGTIACTSIYWGQFAVAQPVLPSPPPLPLQMPQPPPPPPQARSPSTAASPPAGTASVTFTVSFSLDFDTLSQNSSLLESLKQDTTYWLAIHLATAFPALMESPISGLPYYDRVVVVVINRGSVTVQYQARLPQGSSDALVGQLASTISVSTSASLLAGSAYADQVLPPFKVTQVAYEERDKPFWTAARIGIIVGCVGGGALLIVFAILLFQWRRKAQAILPPNPEEAAALGLGADSAGGRRGAGQENKSKGKEGKRWSDGHGFHSHDWPSGGKVTELAASPSPVRPRAPNPPPAPFRSPGGAGDGGAASTSGLGGAGGSSAPLLYAPLQQSQQSQQPMAVHQQYPQYAPQPMMPAAPMYSMQHMAPPYAHMQYPQQAMMMVPSPALMMGPGAGAGVYSTPVMPFQVPAPQGQTYQR